MTKPSMLTPTEAAEYLGIKLSYLYKLMMRRVIPYYKLGASSAISTPKTSPSGSAVSVSQRTMKSKVRLRPTFSKTVSDHNQIINQS